MKRRGVDYKTRKNNRRKNLEDFSTYFHYSKMVFGWVLLMIVDNLLSLRVEFMWPLWVCANLFYSCLEVQGVGWMAVFISFTVFWDAILYIMLPVNWSFFIASTFIWIHYIWIYEKGALQLPSVLFMMLVSYMEISVRFGSAAILPLKAFIFRPLAAHSITFSIILSLNIESVFITDRKKVEDGEEWLKTSECCDSVCKHSLCNYSNGNVKQSNGVIQSLTDNKNNQKKQWDKNEINNSINSENLNYSANGNVASKDSLDVSDKVIVDRIQSVNDYIAYGKEKDCGKNSKNCGVPVKSNSNYKDSNTQQNLASSQKDNKKNKSNRDCNVSQASSQKDDYYQRFEAQLKKAKIDLQISQQVEVNLRNQINTLNQDTKNSKHELYKAHRLNDELQSKLHNLVTTKQADKQTIVNLEKSLAEEKKQRNSLLSQLQNLKKSCKKNEEAKNECTECCKNRRTTLEGENKRLKKELKEKEELYCSAKRDAALLCRYKEKLQDVNILVTKLSAMKEQTTHLELSLRSETKIKLDLFSALGEVKRQLDIREKLIKTQEVEIEHLKYAVTQLKKFNATSLASFSNYTFDLDTDEITPSLLDPNAATYTPNFIKPHLSMGT
ncbi:macoilin-like [Planococcus citri]|uniref:macoilin-like n=1 Tax=Planococcus citri TaxID=170843 RepID=UPI0031F9D952